MILYGLKKTFTIKKTYRLFKALNSLYKNTGYNSLDAGFKDFYSKGNRDDFKINNIVIVIGKLFVRYVRKLKENINKIINISYT